MSNGGSALKTGETLPVKFTESHEMMSCGGGSPQIASTELHNPTTLVWTTRTSMSTARGGGFHFPINGYGHVGAGGAGPSTAHERYNVFTNAWASRTALTQGRDRTQSHTLNGFGYVYSTASSLSNNQQKYNADLDSWSIPASTYSPANGYALGYALLGYGYIIGGDLGGPSGTANLQYSDTLDTFTTKAVVHNVQQGGCVAFGGLGHVMGGYNGGDISIVSAYNPGTNAWTTGPNLGTATSANSSDVEGGLIYSMGGYVSPTANFSYNPHSKVWSSSLSAMNYGSIFPMMCAPGFYRNYEMRVGIPAYYAGVGSWVTVTRIAVPVSAYGFGFVLSDRSYQPVGNDNLWYEQNTTLNSWVAIANSTYSAQYKATFSLLGFGYAAGGNTGLTSTSQYNPSSAVWASTGTLNNSVGYAAGATLNGSGYLLGGESGGMTTFIQKYNPSLGTWASAGSLNSAKYSLDGDSCAGFIYLGGNSSSAFERYNDVTQATTLMATVLDNNTDGMAGCKGDKFYYLGRSAGSVYEYSTQGNFWTIKPSITGRYYIAGGNIGGNFYLSGGNIGGNTGLTTNEAYVDSLKQAVLSAGLNIS